MSSDERNAEPNGDAFDENSQAIPAPKRGLMRRLYDWVLSWTDTPYGTPALFIISFAESSFFPIPPDVLQIALSAGRPKRSFWYATVNLAGSISGACLGYLIGYALWEALQSFFFNHVFDESVFNRVKDMYQTYDFWAVFTAALTPIPYKIFTIAGGVCHISVIGFLFASVVGRGLRFYTVAALMFFCGPTIKKWIERYFEILAVVFCILLIGGFVLIKYLLK